MLKQLIKKGFIDYLYINNMEKNKRVYIFINPFTKGNINKKKEIVKRYNIYDKNIHGQHFFMTNYLTASQAEIFSLDVNL